MPSNSFLISNSKCKCEKEIEIRAITYAGFQDNLT